MTRKQQVVDQLFKGLAGLLKSRKVTVVDGTGTLGPDRTVTVTERERRDRASSPATRVILASGSVPRTIPGFEFDGRLVFSSDEVLEMTELPARSRSSAAVPSAASSPR